MDVERWKVPPNLPVKQPSAQRHPAMARCSPARRDRGPTGTGGRPGPAVCGRRWPCPRLSKHSMRWRTAATTTPATS
eukprot:238481-Pyramimonas_sp.AAC.2